MSPVEMPKASRFSGRAVQFASAFVVGCLAALAAWVAPFRAAVRG